MLKLQIIIVKNALNMFSVIVIMSRPASISRLRWRSTEFFLWGLLFNKNLLVNLFQMTLHWLVPNCFCCIAYIECVSQVKPIWSHALFFQLEWKILINRRSFSLGFPFFYFWIRPHTHKVNILTLLFFYLGKLTWGFYHWLRLILTFQFLQI